jgi:dTMP kinase
MWVVFEGPDGSGKTTIAKQVAESYRALYTREPGTNHNQICRLLREIAFDDDLTSDAQMFIFCADRIQHFNRVVKPALSEGKMVIQDRYIPSTHVYQNMLQAKGASILSDINLQFLPTKPDLTIFLLPSLEVVLARKKDVLKNDVYEKNLVTVYKQYARIDERLAIKWTKKFVFIDSGGLVENTVKECREAIDRLVL